MERAMTWFDHWRLVRYGVVRLRRCFAPQSVEVLRAAAQRAYAEQAAVSVAIEALSEAEQRNHARRMSMIRLDSLGVDGNPAEHVLASTRVSNLARAYLGKEPRCDSRSYVRRLVPGADIQSVPFHQDQTVLRAPLLNIWVPLVACGRTAPGLEVVVTGNRRLLDASGDPADTIPVERVRLDEDAVLASYGARSLWHPALKPGDALAFTGTTIHRSYVTPAMTEPRMSVELRFV